MLFLFCKLLFSDSNCYNYNSKKCNLTDKIGRGSEEIRVTRRGVERGEDERLGQGCGNIKLITDLLIFITLVLLLIYFVYI